MKTIVEATHNGWTRSTFDGAHSGVGAVKRKPSAEMTKRFSEADTAYASPDRELTCYWEYRRKRKAREARAKRGPVVARCYVLRADRNGRTWYVAADGGPPTMLPQFAEEHATIGAARDAKYNAIWPEWRIWRRGRRA